MTHVTIESGNIQGFNHFIPTDCPWYSNLPLTFEQAVNFVNSGVTEYGDPVNLKFNPTHIRVTEVDHNASHGVITREYMRRITGH